ncbi:MAG: ABC transporter ATP-binding protein [Oscillospiraceae bacterium]|nr:ABC transporter ATP-binding protein [Oscillospiraceae bacterium]
MNFISGYKLPLLLSLLTAAVGVVLNILIPLFFGNAIDLIIGKGNVDFDGIKAILIKTSVAVIICAVSTWVMSTLNNRITYGVVKDIRTRAFDRITVLPLSYLDSHPTGDTVNRVINDVDTFADGLLMGFTQFFTGILTIIGTLIMLIRLNLFVALAVVCLTPLSLFVARFIAKHSYDYFKAQSEQKAAAAATADESFSNIKTVKAFGREKILSEKYDRESEKVRRTSLKAIFFSSITNPSTRFVNSIVYAAVALTGALNILSGGTMTVGLLSSALSYANRYTKPFNEISSVFAELQNALACAARVIDLIEEPAEAPDKKDALAEFEPLGNMDIDGVYFSYTPDTPLIEDFNLHVRKGERVAIVGPTGCGKTTFINLLMRFYDVNSGTISIDGINEHDLTRHALRSSFGMVLQETWLKTGTVRENIAMGKPDATDAEIEDAARRAHAHSFIKRLPNGYDTVIGEDGGNLSQGQKQLMCIARVMLMSPPILILDEATSSIDTRTEIKVQKAFAELLQNRTSFVVAHRLSTIVNSDVILVMNKGRIIEQGTHRELLEKNGFYARLWNAANTTAQ